ncbi:MAG: gephyrin-like molybdotransferase Glp [Xanthobacteraceae bacterium]
MTQLSNDCFASGPPVLSVDEAVALIAARVGAVEGTETVPLRRADGRVLVADLVAPLPLPLFTNSAVDGYAVASADLPATEERALPLGGRVAAGTATLPPLAPGHAARIFTGAPLPTGADTVFMQEDVRIDADGVVLPPGQRPGANVRRAGEDVAEGCVVLKAGTRLRPQDVALAAALGQSDLPVRRRIRVAVASTGDEVVSPGAPRGPAQVFDANRFMLMALLERLGCDVVDLGILPDQRARVAESLKVAADGHDLIVTSGGVSTGEEDHVRAGIESVGQLVLWRMAIKPGRPVAMGVIDGTALIGLPGNPVASFVTYAHVVRPTVLSLAGALQTRTLAVPVRAAFAHDKKPGRREFLRAQLRRAPDGGVEAVKFDRQGAGMLSSLVETDGLIELGEDVTHVAPGDSVGFLTYADLD